MSEEILRINGTNGCGPHLTLSFWGDDSPQNLQRSLRIHISGYNSEEKFLDIEETQRLIAFIKRIGTGKPCCYKDGSGVYCIRPRFDEATGWCREHHMNTPHEADNV